MIAGFSLKKVEKRSSFLKPRALSLHVMRFSIGFGRCAYRRVFSSRMFESRSNSTMSFICSL